MAYTEQNQQRKQEIEQMLLTMMLEMPYEKITVRELAERMHVTRKTFYQYFSDKHACLESLVDHMILQGSIYTMKTLPGRNTRYQYFEAQMRFWMEHRDFLNAVIRNHLGDLFLDRIVQFIGREDKLIWDGLKTEILAEDADMLYFYLSGEVAILLKWCSEGFSLPLEEMVRKQLRLTYEPMLRRER